MILFNLCIKSIFPLSVDNTSTHTRYRSYGNTGVGIPDQRAPQPTKARGQGAQHTS